MDGSMDGPMDGPMDGRLTSSAVRTRGSSPIRGRHLGVGVVGIPTRARLRSAAARSLMVPRSVGRRDRSEGLGDRAGGAVPRRGGGGGRRPRLPHAAHPSAASRRQERRGERRTDAAASSARAERCQRDLRSLDPMAGVATIACGLGRRHRFRLVGGVDSSPRRLRRGLLRITRGRTGSTSSCPDAVRSAPGRMDRRGVPRSTGPSRRDGCRQRGLASERLGNRRRAIVASRRFSRSRSLASCRGQPCLQNSIRIASPNPTRRLCDRTGFWR